MNSIRLEILTSVADVLAMAERWNRLLPDRNFFLSLERLAVWLKHDHALERPHVLVFSEGDEPIGMLPLGRYTRRKSGMNVRTLEILGGRSAEFVSIPLPADRPELVTIAFNHLARDLKDWDVLWLEETLADDPVTTQVQADARLRGFAHESYVTALCPYLPLDRPFEELWSGLFDGKSRSDRTRKIKKAEKAPGLTFHRWESGEDLALILDDIAELERSSWKGEEQIGLFTPEYAAWNRDLIQHFASRGEVDLRYARLEGRLVSYRVGFIWEGVYYDYNTAYHPDAAKLSVSSVLLHRNIQDLCAWGVKRIEFNRGVQRYKLEWATGLRENRLVRIYNRTARARVLRGLAAAKGLVKGTRSEERPELPIPLKEPLPPIR